jgi:hypothetical protein
MSLYILQQDIHVFVMYENSSRNLQQTATRRQNSGTDMAAGEFQSHES